MNAICKTLRPWLALLLVAVSPALTQDGTPVSVKTGILSADAQKLVLDIRFPKAFFLKSKGEESLGYTAMIPGCSMSARPGAPALPFFSAPIAVPPNARPSVSVITMEEEEQGCPLIAPAPSLSRSNGGTTRPSDGRLHYFYEKDAGVYQTNACYPADRISTGPVSRIRGVSVFPFKFFPLQYNPVTSKISYVTHVVLQIDFQTSANSMQKRAKVRSRVFDNVLKKTLLNYEQFKAWGALSKKAGSGNAPG